MMIGLEGQGKIRGEDGGCGCSRGIRGSREVRIGLGGQDGGIRSADGAIRGAWFADGEKGAGDGIIGEEALVHGVGYLREDLEDFHAAQDPHETGNGSKNPGIGAGFTTSGGSLRIETAITATAVSVNRELPLGSHRAAADEGYLRKDAGIVDEVARAEVVGGIEDAVMGGDELEGVFGGDALGEGI